MSVLIDNINPTMTDLNHSWKILIILLQIVDCCCCYTLLLVDQGTLLSRPVSIVTINEAKLF